MSSGSFWKNENFERLFRCRHQNQKNKGSQMKKKIKQGGETTAGKKNQVTCMMTMTGWTETEAIL